MANLTSLSIQNNTLAKIGLFIFFCTLLYLPKINAIELSLFPLIIISLFLFAKGAYKYKYIHRIKPIALILAAIILISLFSSLVSLITIGSIELYQSLKHIKVLIYFILIFYVLQNIKLNTREIIKILLISLWVHILTIYLMLFDVNIREMVLSYVNFTPDYPVLYRVSAFSSGYDSASLLSVFSLIIQLNYSYKYNSLNLTIFLSLIIGVTLLFTARVGLVAGIVIMLVFLLNVFKRSHAIQTQRKSSLIILFTMSAVIYMIFSQLYTIESFQTGVFRSFSLISVESIKSQSGVFSSFNSVISIQSILGNGSSAFGANGVKSDMGYAQYLSGIGLFGTLLSCFYYIYSYLLVKYNFGIGYITNIYFMFVIAILTASLKGPYIFSRHTTEIMFVILSIALINRKKSSS